MKFGVLAFSCLRVNPDPITFRLDHQQIEIEERVNIRSHQQDQGQIFMADPLTPEQRRKVMRSNKGKDTKLELAVRRGLYARGLRYRKHGPKSIGSPDIVFKRRRVAIFVHGCFWHQHSGCSKAAKVNHGKDEKWTAKFESNIARDQRNIEKAREAGFRVAVIWECAIEQKRKDSARREEALDRLAGWVTHGLDQEVLEIG